MQARNMDADFGEEENNQVAPAAAPTAAPAVDPPAPLQSRKKREIPTIDLEEFVTVQESEEEEEPQPKQSSTKPAKKNKIDQSLEEIIREESDPQAAGSREVPPHLQARAKQMPRKRGSEGRQKRLRRTAAEAAKAVADMRQRVAMFQAAQAAYIDARDPAAQWWHRRQQHPPQQPQHHQQQWGHDRDHRGKGRGKGKGQQQQQQRRGEWNHDWNAWGYGQQWRWQGNQQQQQQPRNEAQHRQHNWGQQQAPVDHAVGPVAWQPQQQQQQQQQQQNVQPQAKAMPARTALQDRATAIAIVLQRCL